jgi:hypothetical protein
MVATSPFASLHTAIFFALVTTTVEREREREDF